MKYFQSLLILCITLTFLAVSPEKKQAADTPRQIVEKSIAAMSGLRGLNFTLKRKERFNGSYQTGELVGKVQTRPRKIYVKNNYPDDGSEVLWIEGSNKGKALVNPNAFPYVNLNLDPQGSIMMKKQHHCIHELGFGYTLEIIKDALKRHGDDFEKYVKYDGIKTFNGRSVHSITIDYPKFAYVDYTVQAGENLFTIGRKLVVNEMLIVEKNPGIDDYFDVKAGQVIKVPNVYGKVSLLYIDTQNFLPIMQDVQDEKGTIERYEYSNVVVNPTYAADEFTEDFSGYKF